MINYTQNKELYDFLENLSLEDFLQIKREIIERKKKELDLESEKYSNVILNTQKIEILPSKGFTVERHLAKKPGKVTDGVYNLLFDTYPEKYTVSELAEITGFTKKQVADVLTKFGRAGKSVSEKDSISGMNKYYAKK